MARRHSLLTWVPAGGALLLAGCLLPRPQDPPPPARPAESAADDRPPSLSSYRLLSSEPPPPPPPTQLIERVRMEVTPATLRREDRPDTGEKDAAAKPPPDSPLVAALRCALSRNAGEARQVLERYDEADRARLLTLLHLAADIEAGNLERLPPKELADTLDQLRGLIEALRRRAPLELDKVCLCRRIDGFGRYEPLPADYAFQAGSDGLPGERIQVYAEVRNFNCQPRDRFFETVLASSLEVRDEHRQRVVLLRPQRCTDRRSTPRQDYFLNFQFHVPAKLPPGSYTLCVTVNDVTPGPDGKPAPPRSASRSLDFKVRAPGAAEGP
jgi:hypothetical protein